MGGSHDIISATERVRFDLPGTLRHLMTTGDAVTKQEAGSTLRVSRTLPTWSRHSASWHRSHVSFFFFVALLRPFFLYVAPIRYPARCLH